MTQNKKTVAVVYGTRPEIIKLAPLILEINNSPVLRALTICTGQHHELTDQFHQDLRIAPKINFELMRRNQSYADLASRLLRKLDKVLPALKPDILLVQGDTNSAFIAALAAFHNKVMVGHVEAGLRTYDSNSPFPEEMNRRMISTLSTLHFCPTRLNRIALLKEGVSNKSIFVTGNTIVDAIARYESLGKLNHIPVALKSILGKSEKKSPSRNGFVLITSHRRESFGNPLENIIIAIQQLARRFPLIQFIFPVHPNPQVKIPVFRKLSDLQNVHLIEPLAYADLLYCCKHANLILTDSGGIQEEAPSFGTFVLVLRDLTERREGVERGFAKVIGTESQRIIREATMVLTRPRIAKIKGANPYGDGNASRKIVKILENHLK